MYTHTDRRTHTNTQTRSHRHIHNLDVCITKNHKSSQWNIVSPRLWREIFHADSRKGWYWVIEGILTREVEHLNMIMPSLLGDIKNSVPSLSLPVKQMKLQSQNPWQRSVKLSGGAMAHSCLSGLRHCSIRWWACRHRNCSHAEMKKASFPKVTTPLSLIMISRWQVSTGQGQSVRPG